MRFEYDVKPDDAYQGNGFFEPEVIGAAVAACAIVTRGDPKAILSSIRIEHGTITVILACDGDYESHLIRVAAEIKALATRWARDAGWRSQPLNGWPALPPQEPYR